MSLSGKRPYAIEKKSSSVTWKKPRQNLEKRRPTLPIFEPSGLLELDSNNKKGIHVLHVEPLNAVSPETFYRNRRVPKFRQCRFRAVVYRDGQEEPIETYDLFEKSSYLVGRALGDKQGDKETPEDAEIVLADIKIPDETCSKQHCVIQFREIDSELKVHVMDLESSNGTVLNAVELPATRFVELHSEDCLRFTVHRSDSQYSVIFVAG
ncbi:LAMI_0F12156g1_1 [Lachancea mirantina]|uniref:LAMI_0F12156g1_1 n=1 Tax=Lachancea mirantina TaxID=1230905 RepID=A0A1G4K2T3_9SACH|nr:LAMI_0F12156g1_1 [Lachancea mirantina]